LVGFQFRYHPQLRKIKSILDAEEIGKPISMRVQWGEYLPGWHPWEDYRKGYSARKDLGGGVVLTLSHPLDYLRWLLGEVSDLWAFTSKVRELEIDVEGVSEIGLRFKNGVIGSVHLDYIQRQPTHNLEIIGSRGVIRWDYVSGILRVERISENKSRVYELPVDFERNHLFINQMEHLLAVVLGKEEPRCSLYDGIMAQELAMAVHESDYHKRIVSW